MASVPPKEGEPMDGVLRIVYNRCRNLKKAIERATALEKAMEGGKTVNAEQLESIKAKSVRISLLHELEEILRKQAALVTPPKLSNRAAKRLQKEKNSTSENVSGSQSDQGKTKDSSNDQDLKGESLPDMSTSADKDAVSSGDIEPVPGSVENQSDKKAAKDAAELELEIAAVRARETEQSRQLKFATQATLDSVLEIAHVVTFINQPGARDYINHFFEAGHRGLNERKVNYMDMDVLLYFYRMLTSPNGNVPHEQAVQTSVLHCSAYLEFSTREAFPGTTYKTLREIVRSIATCPLMTDRSPNGIPSSGNRGPDGEPHLLEQKPAGLSKSGERAVDPSSLVEQATAMSSHV